MASYVPSTPAERRTMLETLGLHSMADLYRAVPPAARVTTLDLPAGKSELEAAEEIGAMAGKNTVFGSVFRGAGAYKHCIPAVVKAITGSESFVTAYTPYQAEISQGVLQSIFEYQTQICELTGMDAANASVYDGATAAAEAVFMCQERRRTGVLAAATADPQVLEVMRTYCESRGVPFALLPAKDYAVDPAALEELLKAGPACVFVQSPNYYGVLEDVQPIVDAAHAAGARAILSVNPISLGLLKTPGEYGADIAVGEGQPLGLPMSFGGPYLGFMACKQPLMRKLPGRIVGQTADSRGSRCFVLTLQAREQHIRREKASSNICSNEALCAMTASVYLAAMGPGGLRRAAESCAGHAHYLAAELGKLPGFGLQTAQPSFHAFLTGCPVDPELLCRKLEARDILPGLPVEGGILWCCTELNRKPQIDALIAAIREVLQDETAV